MQGVSGGSPGRDGLPVLTAERHQEKLQTGEETEGEETVKYCVFTGSNDNKEAFLLLPGLSLRSGEGDMFSFITD